MGRPKKETVDEKEVRAEASEQVEVQSISEEKKVPEVDKGHSTGGESVLKTDITFS